jgi:hypothetical protein
MMRNRYILKGANYLAAEAYAEEQGWEATEWIYFGATTAELIIIDLEDKDVNW